MRRIQIDLTPDEHDDFSQEVIIIRWKNRLYEVFGHSDGEPGLNFVSDEDGYLEWEEEVS